MTVTSLHGALTGSIDGHQLCIGTTANYPFPPDAREVFSVSSVSITPLTRPPPRRLARRVDRP